MTRRLLPAVIATLLAACGGTSASSSPTDLAGTISEVHVFSATVTPESADTASAAMALHNASAEADQLVGVTCTCATGAEIHGVSAGGDEGPVDGVRLPPDKVVVFGPGGPHVVLVGLTRPLHPGDTVTLQLTFATAEPTTADAQVIAAPTPSAAA